MRWATIHRRKQKLGDHELDLRDDGDFDCMHCRVVGLHGRAGAEEGIISVVYASVPVLRLTVTVGAHPL